MSTHQQKQSDYSVPPPKYSDKWLEWYMKPQVEPPCPDCRQTVTGWGCVCSEYTKNERREKDRIEKERLEKERLENEKISMLFKEEVDQFLNSIPDQYECFRNPRFNLD